jgi:vacuolar-type H+-ATPase subunit H
MTDSTRCACGADSDLCVPHAETCAHHLVVVQAAEIAQLKADNEAMERQLDYLNKAENEAMERQLDYLNKAENEAMERQLDYLNKAEKGHVR